MTDEAMISARETLDDGPGGTDDELTAELLIGDRSFAAYNALALAEAKP
jgi:hypothetical protein